MKIQVSIFRCGKGIPMCWIKIMHARDRNPPGASPHHDHIDVMSIVEPDDPVALALTDRRDALEDIAHLYSLTSLVYARSRNISLPKDRLSWRIIAVTPRVLTLR